ncbi:condensation domain-containing protein [Streptomyces sp. bgisy100]|uniref:condensation domain-containing protein n=1 Tax=Streptomyces sp. bgisy100 TaxID=3413783 RepID=UPI003D7490DE
MTPSRTSIAMAEKETSRPAGAGMPDVGLPDRAAADTGTPDLCTLEGLSPEDLLSRLGALGVRLGAEGDRLRYDAPAALAGPALLGLLRRHKPHLLALLTGIRPGASTSGAAAPGSDVLGGPASGETVPEIETVAPATLQQTGFMTAHYSHPMPQVLNVAMRLTLTGALDVTALRTALTRLVARHESLRLRFARGSEDADTWRQIVLNPRPVPLPVEDLTALDERARADAVDRIGTELASTPIDPEAGVAPVFRLLGLGESHWVLMFSLHHSTCDGWAVSVLLRDFAALYTEEATGVPHGLDDPAPRSTAYVRWQQEHSRLRADERKKAYWARQLDGASFRLELPTDRPRPERLSGRGDTVVFTVPAAVRAGVEALARRRGTTPFAVTAAALGTLLCRLSGRPDVLLNVPYANRERREFETLLACTASSIPLRIRADGSRSFTELVEGTGRDAIAAIDHLMPMWEVAKAVRERTTSDMPDRIPVGFHYQSSLELEIGLPGVGVAVDDLAAPVARGEFGFGLIPTGDVLMGYIGYSTDLWDHAPMERLAESYVRLLADSVRGEDEPRERTGDRAAVAGALGAS